MNALSHLALLQARVSGKTKPQQNLFYLISLIMKATNQSSEVNEEQAVILNDLIFDLALCEQNLRIEAINIATWLNSCH